MADSSADIAAKAQHELTMKKKQLTNYFLTTHLITISYPQPP